MNTYYKEITDWSDTGINVKNHTYIFNDKKQCIGYIKTGTKEELMFKNPSKLFSKRGRKFIKLSDERLYQRNLSEVRS